jgi:hypothetical protein
VVQHICYSALKFAGLSMQVGMLAVKSVVVRAPGRGTFSALRFLGAVLAAKCESAYFLFRCGVGVSLATTRALFLVDFVDLDHLGDEMA